MTENILCHLNHRLDFQPGILAITVGQLGAVGPLQDGNDDCATLYQPLHALSYLNLEGAKVVADTLGGAVGIVRGLLGTLRRFLCFIAVVSDRYHLVLQFSEARHQLIVVVGQQFVAFELRFAGVEQAKPLRDAIARNVD